MFDRIRYAAHVLSASPTDPCHRADIVFEKEVPVEVTWTSRAIGNLIEMAVISIVIGIIGAPFVAMLWPTHQVANVSRLAAVVASVMTFLAVHLFERFKSDVANHLKIGEKIAPYFGHKVTGAIRTLRS